MANLVLKDVDQVVLQTLEQRAKQLGISLEAAAVRALKAFMDQGVSVPSAAEEAWSEAEAAGFESFLRGNEENEDRDGPGRPLGSDAQKDRVFTGPEDDARSLGERQAALARAYPEEYVVFLGERIVAHTANRDEAHARYEEAFRASGGLEPIVVAPGALRRLGPPVLRGRAVPGRESKR